MTIRSATARRRAPARGFTLVELMIGLVVLAIVAAIAFPSFLGAIRKSRRADAMAALAALSQAQERYRTGQPTYGTLSDLTASFGTAAQSPDRHYAITVTGASATGYTAQATARDTSPQYADSKCRVFSFTLAGFDMTYASADASGTANPAPDPCWVR